MPHHKLPRAAQRNAPTVRTQNDAVLQLAKALARQAAREDHAAEMEGKD
jgi:hypothetical protein